MTQQNEDTCIGYIPQIPIVMNTWQLFLMSFKSVA